MSKKNVSIPASLGSSTLTEAFGKITFSPEVKELLSALEAEICVRYNPGAEKPIISIVSNTGKTVCSLEEFKALSGYRRFVGDMLKAVDREASNEKKVSLVAFFLRKAKAMKINPPARILEQNETKFNQLGSMIQIVNNNLENLSTTIENEWKDYVESAGLKIVRILYSAQVLCMGPSQTEKEYIEKELLNAGVPNWLYKKFSDKNFTANIKNDCIALLFPKNNHLKSISLTKKEIMNEPFLTCNEIVVKKSGGIIALAKADFSAFYPKFSVELKEQVDSFIEKYQWTCTSPYSSDEILTVRQSGKIPPFFREAIPRSSGNRPEGELGRVTREIGNLFGKIQSTWNGILHFVIPVANPITEFWAELYTDAASWKITPTNSIYDCIRTSKNFTPLDSLRDASSKIALERINSIVAQVLMVPAGTTDFGIIESIFKGMANKQKFVKFEDFVDKIVTDHPIDGYGELKINPVIEAEKEAARMFLGNKEFNKTKKKNRSGQSSVRLSTRVLNELKPIAETALYEPVKSWLMSTFKTGDRNNLQLIAAERVLGEAIKHQDEIFPDMIGEDELFEIEEYYEED